MPVLLVLCGLLVACGVESLELQEGDLLFQDLDCGPLCEAIEAVTEGVDGKDFSHCAMVVRVNDNLMAVEAIGNAVQLTSLEAFFARSKDTRSIERITVARLKKEYRNLVPAASSYALEQIGQPYDHKFLLDNGAWYCSELLYEAFKSASGDNDFFELSPMTYKDPDSDAFFPAWIDYYQKLKAEIPEGKPGLNPGSISRSDKIEIIELDKI